MTEISKLTNVFDLIEYRANSHKTKPYILHEDTTVTYDEFNRFTCMAANGLTAQGAESGDGVAILMGNCPEYLYLFYGLPRAGFYTVPINTALKGDGLKYILTHSDVKYLVVDDTLYPRIADLGEGIESIDKIFIRNTTDELSIPSGLSDLQDLFCGSPEKPDHIYDPNTITYLMYTSGTTGFPKGVVNRLKGQSVQGIMALASLQVKPDDVLFTALPLFHANALLLTASFSMAAGVPFGLEKRFSASKFWDQIRKYGATQFNAIGAMIPILMKQPEKPDDADNSVRLIVSAACPANLWESFQTRFGLQIWEAYGAVDGGGVLLFNFGDAPVGSVGNGMLLGAEWKLVNEKEKEVPEGEVGELIAKARDNSGGGVEYYKNREASQKKCRNGWIYTGDLFYPDKENNLYFVDRKTDSMRRRGENISSFEVENVVEKYGAVASCAAFGVPSDMGEDEVMIWITPKNGKKLDLEDLVHHCADNMAYFMVPRYIDVVDHIPRTGTLRVKKVEMKKQGVTERTWDRETEMPDFKFEK